MRWVRELFSAWIRTAPHGHRIAPHVRWRAVGVELRVWKGELRDVPVHASRGKIQLGDALRRMGDALDARASECVGGAWRVRSRGKFSCLETLLNAWGTLGKAHAFACVRLCGRGRGCEMCVGRRDIGGRLGREAGRCKGWVARGRRGEWGKRGLNGWRHQSLTSRGAALAERGSAPGMARLGWPSSGPAVVCWPLVRTTTHPSEPRPAGSGTRLTPAPSPGSPLGH